MTTNAYEIRRQAEAAAELASDAAAAAEYAENYPSPTALWTAVEATRAAAAAARDLQATLNRVTR